MIDVFRGLLRPVAIGLALLAAVRTVGAADLLELHAQAVQYDPQFQAALHQRRIADALFQETKGAARPSLVGSAEASWTNQNIVSSESFLFPEGRTDFFSDAFSLVLSQPVYRPDVMARIPQARTQIRQAAFQFIEAEQDLIVRLAEACFRYLVAGESLDLASAERRANERQLQESQQRLASGLGTAVDLHEARSRFAQAQAAEVTASDSVEDARQALAEIVGLAPVEVKRLSETFSAVAPDRMDVEAWVQTALLQNPGVLALSAAADAAEAEIRVQRAAKLPAVDLTASVESSDSGGSQFGAGNEIRSGRLGLRARIPIYDGGRAEAAARSAGLQRAIAVQRIEREKSRVERETRAAFQGVVGGIARVEALQQTVFSAEAALELREESLRAGLGKGLEVLDARRELFSARRELAQARYEYLLNGLKLKQAVGTLGDEDLRQLNAHFQ